MTTFEMIMWAVFFIVPIGYAIYRVYGIYKYFKDLEKNETESENNPAGLCDRNEESQ